LCNAVISIPSPASFCMDRAHLIGGEDEIAHDQRLIPFVSKGEPGAERQRRLQLHAIEHTLRSVRGRPMR
jgi:hypothetical protein